MKRCLFLLACFSMPLSVPAAECTAHSGPARATILELYTSEGCSSCPPADRWFSRVEAPPAGASVVPLAFHVAYWDYIGWKDRFASPVWTERQRDAMLRSGSAFVYTPQVIFDGRDLRDWSSAQALRSALSAAAAKPAGGTIGMRLSRSPSGLEVSVDAALLPGRVRDATLVAALTESRLATSVRAGENKGASLTHDHVVRVLEPLGHVTGSTTTLARTFAIAPDWKVADLAVSAWLQDSASGEVLQALRLEVCTK